MFESRRHFGFRLPWLVLHPSSLIASPLARSSYTDSHSCSRIAKSSDAVTFWLSTPLSPRVVGKSRDRVFAIGRGRRRDSGSVSIRHSRELGCCLLKDGDDAHACALCPRRVKSPESLAGKYSPQPCIRPFLCSQLSSNVLTHLTFPAFACPSVTITPATESTLGTTSDSSEGSFLFAYSIATSLASQSTLREETDAAALAAFDFAVVKLPETSPVSSCVSPECVHDSNKCSKARDLSLHLVHYVCTGRTGHRARKEDCCLSR